MVHFSGKARKMNHLSSFARAKRARISNYNLMKRCPSVFPYFSGVNVCTLVIRSCFSSAFLRKIAS
ncbi:MAG: hypothetical protein U5L45_24795 [Saprospiraceae bacterium]|nr:hypothetical protein [Saprospiraceae bacterium]